MCIYLILLLLVLYNVLFYMIISTITYDIYTCVSFVITISVRIGVEKVRMQSE